MNSSFIFTQLETARYHFKKNSLTTSNGLTWHLRDTGGRGPVVVFIPGAFGTADTFFRQLIALSAQFRCIAVDYPNASSKVLAEGLNDLLQRLELQSVSLVGVSYGGYWLQHFAARYPQKLDRIILANTFIDTTGISQHDLFNAAKVCSLRVDDVQHHYINLLQSVGAKELKLLRFALISQGQDSDCLKGRVSAIANDDGIAPVLPHQHRRITIISCGDDPIVSFEAQEALRDRYPGAVHIYFDLGGHWPQVSISERFNQIVRDIG